MLEKQLALIEAPPPRGLPWLVPALVAAVAASGALLFTWAGEPFYAGLFVAGMVAMLVAAFVIERREGARVIAPVTIALPDYALAAALLEASKDAVALSDSAGSLVSANTAYRERFGDKRPDSIASDADGAASLEGLRSSAWRDGSAVRLAARGEGPVTVQRVGGSGDLLLWRFERGRRDM